MRQEIEDPRKWRISMSGLSIKTGWGDDKRIVAKYPEEVRPLDEKAFATWIADADEICQLHNAALTPNV